MAFEGDGADRRAVGGDWVLSLGAVSLCSAVMIPLRSSLVLLDVALVYLLGIVLVASRASRLPTLAATVLSVAAFDFLFVPPVYFFSFVHPRTLFTDFVMFVVAYTTSSLTLRVRGHAAEAERRERQTATLYSLSRELAANAGIPRLTEIAVRHVEEALPAQAAVLLEGVPGAGHDGPGRSAADADAARHALESGETSGRGTGRSPGASALYLPLRTASRTLGLLRVTPAGGEIPPAGITLLESFAQQTAMALERALLVDLARRAALQAEREAMRSTLLSSISHDLRTPLAAIVGAATALQDEGLELSTGARAELVQAIAEESEHLDRIVRNILALTQLESAMGSIRREVQSIEELVGAAVARLGPRLAGRRLAIGIPGDLPLVPCDPILVGLVVVNLLENALKFTPPGSPLEIEASAASGMVRVELRDRGPGVEAGAEDRIFEKFTRGAGHTGGLGLGLAICRAIVTAHGGRIWAASRPGGGAVFTFTLPAADPPAEGIPPALP